MALALPPAEPPTPARVAAYVVRHEGAHFREIQRGLGLSTGQADHHLRRFVREGMLARTPLAGEVHFFPVTRARAERRPLAALRHPARMRVARVLALRGRATLRGLAEAAGMPESTLLHHLRVLLRAGVVFRAEAGRRVAWGLSEPEALPGLLAAAERSLNGTAAGDPRPAGTPPRRAPR